MSSVFVAERERERDCPCWRLWVRVSVLHRASTEEEVQYKLSLAQLDMQTYLLRPVTRLKI